MSIATGPTVTSSDRPRVGIDITPAVSQGGGIGRYTRELVRALVGLDGSHHYLLFSAKPPAQRSTAYPIPVSPHITYRRAPLSERWLYRVWFRLRLPLPVQWLTGPLDLYHSPDFVLPPVAGGVPTLLTVHDLSFVHHPETFTPSLVNYLSKVVPRSVRRATHILADSRATKRDLVMLWSVPEDKVTVLYSGVDAGLRPVTSNKQITAVRHKYGLGDAPYLFSVSTIQPRKNYQMLIRAFRPLTENHPHHLVIAGSKGWMYEQVLAEASVLGLENRVHFIGFADDEDLPALYSAATLFVFPSLYEGFGLPLIEAMACGTPVLASDTSCLPEVAGDAAILLPPGAREAWTAAMMRLLAEPAERMTLVAAGFLRARRFTWKKAATQLQGVYRGLLKESPAGR